MNRFQGIDRLRFIGAFCIMLLHTSMGDLNSGVEVQLRLLGRWAVPFYFIVTGYFLGSKFKNGSLPFVQIEKNIVKLFTVLLVSSVGYYFIDIYSKTGTIGIENIFIGTYHHLWFIGSMIFGYFIIWFLHFLKTQKYLPFLALIMLIAALFSDSYDQILGLNISYNLPRFLSSIPFMYIGIIVRRKEELIFSLFPTKKVTTISLISLFLFGWFLQLLEAYGFWKFYHYHMYNHQLLIGSVVMGISIFLISLYLFQKEDILSNLGRRYTLFIYLYHPAIYFMMELVIFRYFSGYLSKAKMGFPIIGFLIALGLGVFLNRRFKRVFKILNGNII